MSPEEIFTKNLDIVLDAYELSVYKYEDGYVEVELTGKGSTGVDVIEVSGPSLTSIINRMADKLKGIPDAAP